MSRLFIGARLFRWYREAARDYTDYELAAGLTSGDLGSTPSWLGWTVTDNGRNNINLFDEDAPHLVVTL